MITAGSAYGCGIENGAVLCWGSNNDGELGSAVGQVSTSPVSVPGLSNMVRVSAGPENAGTHTCALSADGTAYCWGANDTGQLGDGTNTQSTAPVAVQGGHKFAEISAGSKHTCGLTKGGDLWCWGRNFWGALGDDTRNDSNAPVRVQDPA